MNTFNEDASNVEIVCKEKPTFATSEDFEDLTKHIHNFLDKYHGNVEIIGTEICYRIYYNKTKQRKGQQCQTLNLK